LIPWNIHSKTPIFQTSKEKFRLTFAMEILLGTNAEYTRNFFHVKILTFNGK
jgi:hypothetical protein